MHTIQKMNPQVNGDKALLILKESKGFTEFHKEEKREEKEVPRRRQGRVKRGESNQFRKENHK